MTITKRLAPGTVVRVVVALVGVGCLLVAAQGAVWASQHGYAIMNDREHDLTVRRRQVDFETLWREFVAQVPPGSRIALAPDQPNKTLWHQRISEFAALNRCLVVLGPKGDYVVSVAFMDRQRPAGPGVRLVVRKVV
ncbi:hypothetical protein [Micromonospora chokoriensis]|uniref:hypothetical protein n=1 Tax=Micromonospora chokoriensis TaxID=356851 RepID=UPI0004C455A9|nr:hypothetical protein [Micromonospora chokoriensis]